MSYIIDIWYLLYSQTIKDLLGSDALDRIALGLLNYGWETGKWFTISTGEAGIFSLLKFTIFNKGL